MSEVVQVQPTVTTGDCPECDGKTAPDGQETVCRDCGLVLEDEPIDHGPEWRAYDEESSSRVGTPRSQTMHDGGIGSNIGRYRDGYGDIVEPSKLARLNRQRVFQHRARFESKRMRNRAYAFGEIHRMCSALGVDDGRREQICRLFKQAQERDIAQGRSLEALAAASIYAISRINKDYLQRSDVEKVARVSRKDIDDAYAATNRELGLPTPPPEPQQYIGKIADQLNLDAEVRRRAGDLVAKDVDGKKPAGVAAGAVYAAAKQSGASWVTQETVADAAGVSAVTVRARFHDLQEAMGS